MSPKNYNIGKRKTQNDMKFEKSVNDFMKLQVFFFFSQLEMINYEKENSRRKRKSC